MIETISQFFSTLYLQFDQWLQSSGIAALGVVLLVIGVVLAFVGLLLQQQRQQLRQTIAGLDEQLQTATAENSALQRHNSELGEQHQQLNIRLERLETQLELQHQQLQTSQSELVQSRSQVDSLQQRNQQLTIELERSNTLMQEKKRHFDDQIRLLNEAREQLKKDFELLANEILENKGKAFREINQQAMRTLLDPVQAEMKGFREKVETLHTEETKQRTQLRSELQNLQKLNQAITDQAEQLTNALQGQKKVQGNWGELILENVLDSSGLRAGQDYQREVSFKTDSGRKRPDAIVYLPKGKHLVIDAKTSLSAYTRYINAETELERQAALSEHAAAVEARIRELADKSYYNLPGLNTPEVVIMFIPIESAYVEALRYKDTLYQQAIENNVLVATPTTLLTSLNIVRQLWQFEDRNKHTAELAGRAEKFYNKLNAFLSSMQKVGDQLDNARETYDKAVSQLYSGRGNLIKQAAEFKELGVSVQKELPELFVDKARLEIDYPGDDSHQGDRSE